MSTTKEKEYVLPEHVRATAYQDGVDAATAAYAAELKPNQNDYRGEYGFPRELETQLRSRAAFKTEEDLRAGFARKKELEELWFAWLRGWQVGGRDAMIERLKLPNGMFGPAFLSTTFEESNGKRVVIDFISVAGRPNAHPWETKVHLRGERYPQSLTAVMPERREEIREMFSSTQDLIDAAEATVVEMQRILKTLKGSKK